MSQEVDPRFSKYKPTVLTDLAAQDVNAEALIPKGGSNDRPGFHTIKEGNNNFRLLPAHDGGTSYRYPLCRSILPLPHEEKDDRGKVTKTIKGKSVFNARVHGNQSWIDPIEEYIMLATKAANENFQNKDDAKKHLKFIFGFNEPGGGYKGGIKPTMKWLAYAYSIENGRCVKMGRLEMTDSAKSSLENLAQKSETVEGAIGSEPFTSPLDGMPITIEYNKAEMPAKKYQCRFYTGPTAAYPVPMPLTSANLDEFEAAEPLHDIYIGSYTRKDFDLALEGLQIFDGQHPEYGILQTAKWAASVAKMITQFPTLDESEEEEEEIDEPLPAAITKKLDGYDHMDRATLKQYIVDNDLNFKVYKTTADEAIREAIRELMTIKTAGLANFDVAHPPAPAIEEEEDDTDLPFKVPAK